VGFLEPEFFAYYEETGSICQGLSVMDTKYTYNPKAMIWHKVAASSGAMSYLYLYQDGSVIGLFLLFEILMNLILLISRRITLLRDGVPSHSYT
jgi:GT2 family glycosyltransferase